MQCLGYSKASLADFAFFSLFSYPGERNSNGWFATLLRGSAFGVDSSQFRAKPNSTHSVHVTFHQRPSNVGYSLVVYGGILARQSWDHKLHGYLGRRTERLDTISS